ncbi:hypothetical protein YTPLAS18_18010 [Nitrospira sp.]|nr:hypothetical protein YTPLAS18_18010 [Nitrospira sp.]
MLATLLQSATKELVPVDDDPAVQVARGPMLAAKAKLEDSEIEEKHLIALVSGLVPNAMDLEIEAAREKLGVVKGTQNGWFYPVTKAARAEYSRLKAVFDSAKAAAQRRLLDAGVERMRELAQELAPLAARAQTLAVEIQKVRHVVGNDPRLPEHPALVLLRGGPLDFQLDVARRSGLLD